jgi:hypothetical protein
MASYMCPAIRGPTAFPISWAIYAMPKIAPYEASPKLVLTSMDMAGNQLPMPNPIAIAYSHIIMTGDVAVILIRIIMAIS